MFSASWVDGQAYMLGAPEVVLARCVQSSTLRDANLALEAFTGQGLRVLAVAKNPSLIPDTPTSEELSHTLEPGLELLALIGIEDPPREGVAEALEACRVAGVRVAMVTGDNARTASAIGTEVGLLRPGGVVVEGSQLPEDDGALADLLDRAEGAVVARVTPADKLRIARALRGTGTSWR